MNILLLCVNCVLLFFLAWAFYQRKSELQWLYWPALVVKIVAGIALGLVYSFYYVYSDTFSFFNDGVVLANLFKQDAREYIRFLWRGDDTFTCWNQLTYHDYRSMFLVKIVSLLNLVTGNNYWFTSIYFSFISFASSWRMLQALLKYFPNQKPAFVIACFGVPTVIFWSSGIIKESMELAALFLITAVFLKFWMRDKVKVIDIVLVVFSMWVLWQIKYYYAAVLFAVLFTTIVIHKAYSYFIKTDRPFVEVGIWFCVLVVPLLVVTLLHPNFYFENFLGVVVKNYNVYLKYSRYDAVIHYFNLTPTVSSIIINAPWAFFSCMFRPFLWEVPNVFGLLASIENLMLLILTLSALPRLKSAFLSQHRLIFLSMMVYIVLLGVFLALSAPNFGTLSRFRVGFIPFYVILICLDNPIIQALSKIAERTIGRLVR